MDTVTDVKYRRYDDADAVEAEIQWSLGHDYAGWTREGDTIKNPATGETRNIRNEVLQFLRQKAVVQGAPRDVVAIVTKEDGTEERIHIQTPIVQAYGDDLELLRKSLQTVLDQGKSPGDLPSQPMKDGIPGWVWIGLGGVAIYLLARRK